MYQPIPLTLKSIPIKAFSLEAMIAPLRSVTIKNEMFEMVVMFKKMCANAFLKK